MSNKSILKKTYERMSNEQLLILAQDGASELLPEAIEALEKVLLSRSLNVEIKPVEESVGEKKLNQKKSLAKEQSVVLLVLLAGNLIVDWLRPPMQVYELDGTPLSASGASDYFILALFVSFPIMAGLLALLVSLVPYRKVPFKEKVLNTWPVILALLYFIILLGGLWNLLITGLG